MNAWNFKRSPRPGGRPTRAGRWSWILVAAAVSLLGTAVDPATAQKPMMAKPRIARPGASPGLPNGRSRVPASVRGESTVVMEVIGVQAQRRDAAIRTASGIDQWVDQDLDRQGISRNEPVDDATFLRRVYLDVAGRIPTLDEANEFLASEAATKRMDLIDKLLGSADSVSHFYNTWADTLRLVERPQPNIIADPYLAYVKDAIRTNMPYDRWVYEMLTADGKIWENPATGYQLRDEGMPLPYIDNTVRVFLGTQIGCAQCHDHPFDVWTQKQFYELAAFTTGVTSRVRAMPASLPMKIGPRAKRRDPMINPANRLVARAKNELTDRREFGAFQRIVRANSFSIGENPNARLRLPHDYAYDNGKPGDVVKPQVPWGEIPSSAMDRSPRHQFAAWVTSADNPQFTKTIVNRMWDHYFGIGLVDPVDDFSDENPCVNEPLIQSLAQSLVDERFDLKQLARGILYSRTYQSDASDYDVTSGETYHFPGPVVRRMTAEQIWDSMLTLAVQNPWPFQRADADDFADVLDMDLHTVTFQQALQRSRGLTDNNDLLNVRRIGRQHAYQGNVLCRASELPSPAPLGHFLREFGQGDRETIQSGNQDATVPQILAMFNGPIAHVMLEPGSAIVDNVMKQESMPGRVDAIFLSVLTRQPTAADRRIVWEEIRRNDTQTAVAMGNVIWSLVNTREFLFID